jgi:hypothetical protein
VRRELCVSVQARLADGIVKQVTVDRDKSVEFELYLPEKAMDVLQSVRSGCPGFWLTIAPLGSVT